MKFIPQITNDLQSQLLLFFIGVVSFQVLYLIVFQLRLLLHKKKKAINHQLPAISVVICARNEEDNLYNNLPKILEQNYPNFEVVVVNDQSQDGSMHIIKAYQKKYNNIKYIELEKNKHRHFGKKLPLTVGVKGSKNELIVVTDADCWPSSKQWLKLLAENYNSEKQIVLGYSPHKKLKGFLNKVIRFDTAAIAITYMSFAKTGLAYMGVGRNMAYSKKLFDEVGGFKNHYQIASGDDDLFIKDASNRKNVAIEINEDSFVYTDPKTTWKTWVSQKHRHFTTAPQYKLINKMFLGIFPLTLYLMYLSFFILLFNSEWTYFIVTILGIRTVLYWIIYTFLLKKYKVKDLIWCYPCFELLHAVLMPFIYYSNTRSDLNKW